MQVSTMNESNSDDHLVNCSSPKKQIAQRCIFKSISVVVDFVIFNVINWRLMGFPDSIHPPPAFGSSSNLEALALEVKEPSAVNGNSSVNSHPNFPRYYWFWFFAYVQRLIYILSYHFVRCISSYKSIYIYQFEFLVLAYVTTLWQWISGIYSFYRSLQLPNITFYLVIIIWDTRF